MPNDSGSTCAILFSQRGSQKDKIFVKQFYSICKPVKLVYCDRYGCVSVAKKLMEGRGKRTVNANDVYERTPLHLAAQQGHDELVEFFLKKGGKIDR